MSLMVNLFQQPAINQLESSTQRVSSSKMSNSQMNDSHVSNSHLADSHLADQLYGKREMKIP